MLHLTPETRERLRTLAYMEGRSMSAIVDNAVRAHWERYWPVTVSDVACPLAESPAPELPSESPESIEDPVDINEVDGADVDDSGSAGGEPGGFKWE